MRINLRIGLVFALLQFCSLGHTGEIKKQLDEGQIAAFENFFANTYLKSESSCLSDEGDLQWRIQLFNSDEVAEFAKCFEDGKFVSHVGCSSLKLVGALKTNSVYVCNVKNQTGAKSQNTKIISQPGLAQPNVVRAQTTQGATNQTQSAQPVAAKTSSSTYVDLPQNTSAANQAAAAKPAATTTTTTTTPPASTAAPTFCIGPAKCDGSPREVKFIWQIPVRDAMIRIRDIILFLNPEDNENEIPFGEGGKWDIPSPCNKDKDNDARMLAVNFGPRYGYRKMICAPDYIEVEDTEKYVGALEKADVDTLPKVTANVTTKYRWVWAPEPDPEGCRAAFGGGAVISSGGVWCNEEMIGHTFNPSGFAICGVKKCVRIEGGPITGQ